MEVAAAPDYRPLRGLPPPKMPWGSPSPPFAQNALRGGSLPPPVEPPAFIIRPA